MAVTAQAGENGESAEPVEVLGWHEPLSRDSLKERAVVEALWQRAGERSDVEQSAYGVWLILTDAYAAEGNPKLFEVKTALAYFGLVDYRDTSLGFEHEIARRE